MSQTVYSSDVKGEFCSLPGGDENVVQIIRRMRGETLPAVRSRPSVNELRKVRSALCFVEPPSPLLLCWL